MKSITRSVFFASYWLTALMFWCTPGVNAATTDSELRIVTEVFPPFQMLNKRGYLYGKSVAKVQRALNVAGINTEIEILPWARAYKLSLERPNTLIFSLARSSERENLYIWLEKLDSARTWMFKRATNTELNIDNFDTPGDWLVGVERGDIAATHLFEQVPKTRFIVSTNTADSVRMLYSGRVDLVPTNVQQLDFYCVKIGCSASDFTPLFELKGLAPDIYLAAHPDTDPTVIHKVKAAFAAPVSNTPSK